MDINYNVKNKKSVVLFSGGLDSTTTLKIALDQGFEPIPVTFFYNQRHKTEVEHAKNIINYFGIKKHIIVNLDFGSIKGSALTDKNISVPKNRINSGKTHSDIIPSTYVPARNTIFLSYALAAAEVEKASDIFIGANYIDYSGYPDCRPEYLASFEKTANLATKAGVTGEISFKINAPLLKLSKKDIILKAVEIGAPLELTHSCYDPIDGLACGICDSCILRKRGFEEAGIHDPTKYFRNPAN
ncbi:MAG: 7-cyano-7-deazaguanine synthase QueC [Candidatus Acidulodesulfobacterium sp.]